MSSYFQNFPVVDYRFGNESATTRFQHLGTYVDIIDQVKDYSVYYETYHIRNGERPEQLSYALYRNTDYYWTFYLLNDHLRTNGWPIRDADLFPKAQQYYPNSVCTTYGVVQKQGLKLFDDGNGLSVNWVPLDELLPLSKSTTFKEGNYVYFASSKTAGQILSIDQRLGAITHDAKGVRDVSVDRTVETISKEDADKVKADSSYVPQERLEVMEVYKNQDEHDAAHHYEDVEGNWIWPDWNEKYPNAIDHGSININTINSVSNFQRIIDLNEEQKIISVIKRENIPQIASEFNRLLQFG